jgi:iron complex transport system ATP-binding protein
LPSANGGFFASLLVDPAFPLGQPKDWSYGNLPTRSLLLRFVTFGCQMPLQARWPLRQGQGTIKTVPRSYLLPAWESVVGFLRKTHSVILETIDLQVGYRQGKDSLPVLSEMNLRLPAGKLTALIGANGSGKSTLMRTLAGVQVPLAGEVRVLGQPLAQTDRLKLARRISVVLSGRIQEDYLSAGELVALGRHPHTGWSGRLGQADRAKIEAAFAATGTAQWRNRYVGQLSDGQAQKVLIARALAQDTPLMLLDEPTAHLDIMNRAETMQLLRQLAEQYQKSILVATHDLDIALQTAHEVWVIGNHGQLSTGLPEQLALDGVFSATLASPLVAFDRADGLFKFKSARSGPFIWLDGDPIGVFWTRRALEKAGFSLASQPGPDLQQVVVAAHGDVYQWQLGDKSLPDLASLLARMAQVNGSFLPFIWLGGRDLPSANRR